MASKAEKKIFKDIQANMKPLPKCKNFEYKMDFGEVKATVELSKN